MNVENAVLPVIDIKAMIWELFPESMITYIFSEHSDKYKHVIGQK